MAQQPQFQPYQPYQPYQPHYQSHAQPEVVPLVAVPPQLHQDVPKPDHVVYVEPANSDRWNASDSSTTASTWQTGFWRRFPWLGMGALLAVLLCSVAAVLILVKSNRTSAENWANGKVAPNVLLSVTNSISGLAITMAVGHGIAINWWRRALAGQTVKQLHYAWSFSSGIGDIIKKFKYFNVIALAALMTKFAIIDGVLYQKATSSFVSVLPNQYKEPVKAFGATMFPVTGHMGSSPTSADGSMTGYFAWLSGFWSTIGVGLNQNTMVWDCNGLSCKFGLPGAGFAANCTSQTRRVDYGQSARAAYISGNTTAYENLTLFSIEVSRQWPSLTRNYSSLILEITYPDTTPSKDDVARVNGTCPTDLVTTTCELRPAVLNYTVLWTNDTSVAKSEQKSKNARTADTSEFVNGYKGVFNNNNPYPYYPSLGGAAYSYSCDYDADTNPNCTTYDPARRQLVGTEVLHNIDEVNEIFIEGQPSYLEGFYQALQTSLSSFAKLSYNGDDWHIHSEGSMSTVMAYWGTDTGYCNYSYYVPQGTILQQINSLTLMTSQFPELFYYTYDVYDNTTGTNLTYYDPTTPLWDFIPIADMQNVTVDSWVSYKEIFYESDYKYMYGAFAATLVVIICILPVYWGFWELGRKVTLGPLEIANAFQGPAFANVKGDHVEEVIKHVGRQKVVYAQIDGEGGKRLAFTPA